MVGVAQLAERCVVVADVAGSSPVTHPIFCEGNGWFHSSVGAKWGQPSPNTHKLTRVTSQSARALSDRCG